MDDSKKLYEKKLVIPMSKKMWEKLKKIAHDHNMSMNQLVRNGIELIIKKYENKS